MQACFTSGLLLTGALYLVHAEDIPRSIVLITVGLVTVVAQPAPPGLSHPALPPFERGVGTRNVLIVGTGPEAHGSSPSPGEHPPSGLHLQGLHRIPRLRCALCGRLGATWSARFDTLFQDARKHFVDEIFFTTPCERGIVQDVLEQARAHGVDLRVVPDMYDGLAWNSPIEYIGQFPTIPLHRGHVPEMELLLKRALDIVFSSLVLILLSPLLALIAIAIKLDSPGPGLLFLGAHRQEGPRLPLHQVPHHGPRRGPAPRRRDAHERARRRAVQDLQRSPHHPAGPLPAQVFAG